MVEKNGESEKREKERRESVRGVYFMAVFCIRYTLVDTFYHMMYGTIDFHEYIYDKLNFHFVISGS